MTAIVLFGELRTFKSKIIADSYRKFLGSSFRMIDLYVACWNKRGYSAAGGGVIQSEYSRREQVFTVSEVRDHFAKFEFFNIITVELFDFEETLASWPQEYREIYNTPFLYHHVTTSIPVQFLIQHGSRMIQSPEKYKQVYFMRPDARIMCPLDFNSSETVLRDNVLHYNTPNDRAIDYGFFMSGNTVKILRDLFDSYIHNMKNCEGSDPYFSQPYDTRDNNHLLAFHFKSRGVVTFSHNPIWIFNLVHYGDD